MPDRFNEEPALSEQLPAQPQSASGFRLALALSIPLYLVLTWILTTWLPDYPFLALIPAVFALHSAAALLWRTKE